MIELCWVPSFRRMTDRTVVVEVSLLVVRVLHTVEVIGMTGVAIRRRPIEVPIHVALATLCLTMRTGQWESPAAVVELSRAPAIV